MGLGLCASNWKINVSDARGMDHKDWASTASASVINCGEQMSIILERRRAIARSRMPNICWSASRLPRPCSQCRDQPRGALVREGP